MTIQKMTINVKFRKPVILASMSPRRIELLKRWGVSFRVKPSHIHEKTARKRPSAIVRDLALQKASAVAKTLSEGLVIGADTIVVLQGKIIGKPKHEEHAHEILSRLNGSLHRVYSGVAVVDAGTGKSKVVYDVSKVKMRRIKPEELRLLSRKHLDKAGAYAVQEKEDAFVEKIWGDYYTVVGLPYFKTKKLLKEFGINMRAVKSYKIVG
jgi:septum formation protein